MKWLNFLSGSRKDESGISKSSSLRSQSNPSTDCGLPRSSDFNSQNVSDTSAESLGRPLGRSSSLIFSQRQNTLRVFTMSELKSATKNFSRSLMVGEGGFGCVYKGTIKSTEDPYNRIVVAVKQLNRNGQQGHKEWMTEVNFLGIVEHPNLVKLIGYCAEDDERGIQRLLVYEFMPNRSVTHHLLSRSDSYLSWSMRLKIALNAAQGLAYLHEGMDFQIIFRDFKSANILLDEQWNAKLSDFGLARQGPAEGLSHVTTVVVGTLGYAAPEYIHTGHLTARSDIWSYGVFLYELITGRPPVDRNRPKGEKKMLEWVRPYLSDAKGFRMIMDKRLEVKYSLKTAMKLAKVANKCLAQHPKSRPMMSEVVEMVKKIVDSIETGAPHPPLVCDTAEETAKEGEKKEKKLLCSEEKKATLKEGAKKRSLKRRMSKRSLKRRMSEFKWVKGWWAGGLDSIETGAPWPPLVCDTAEETAKEGEKKEKLSCSEGKKATLKEGAKKRSLKRRMSEFKWVEGWWAGGLDSIETGAPRPPLVCDTAEETAKEGEKKEKKLSCSEEKKATLKEGGKKKSLKRRMSEFKWAEGWWARWSFWTLKVIKTN